MDCFVCILGAVKEKAYQTVAKIAQKRPVYQEMCTTVYSNILNEEIDALVNFHYT